MRLLVADPRALLRAGLARLLADLGPVETIEAETLAGAIERADRGFAAALVAETLLAGEGVAAVGARLPTLPLLVLSMADGTFALLAAIRAGVQ